ncbi:BpuSI family type II restriction endonuclease [Alkalibacterium sp. MB6]|uniref:BpuSI family type II restriction endonuclease n=1 Tax=Alkalibacterium sp. MB6 TaxID=2081965 RepID=UPI00137B7041|nr:BpuSI family type II restriction endonuclease [Alkalibacterium sp. MB6]
MWLSYSDSEVVAFHPVCEEALVEALTLLNIQDDYEVKHHEYTGTLEMDFVIKNRHDGKYLCVIEVKRTPSDINSARYQYQAMSYVQSNGNQTEQPFYILTNLENMYIFRYDSERPRVVQQILKPGLKSIGKFQEYTREMFINKLSNEFKNIIKTNILDQEYVYSNSLSEFQDHMRSVVNKNKEWKTSLVFLLYEYIRGVFNELDLDGFRYDIRRFRNNVNNVCTEAMRVNFNEIFNKDETNYIVPFDVPAMLLELMYESGKTYADGDYISNLLHEVASIDQAHNGEVPTDLELSRFLSILAKQIANLSEDGKISDPASGSGNLITSAIEIFNITPERIKANDKNEKLLELLSLRIGLNNPRIISKDTSPKVTAKNINDLDENYFNDVDVILLNPPYVAGINSVERKKELFASIKRITGKRAITSIGQIGLEAPFIELISALAKENTTIACIIPVGYLTGRGIEAVKFREFLLQNFGLKTIFTYPSSGLFESVAKKTCVVIGRVNRPSESIQVLSAYMPLKDINVSNFERNLQMNESTNTFTELTQGIDVLENEYKVFSDSVGEGWRGLSSVGFSAVEFMNNYFSSHPKLVRLKDIPSDTLKVRRGWAGNDGASNLVFLDRNHELINTEGLETVQGIRSVRKFNSCFINEGDYLTIDYKKSTNESVDKAINTYLETPQSVGKQARRPKSYDELKKILMKDSSKIIEGYKLLLPRAIRPTGKVFYTDQPIVISTNFNCFYSENENDIKIYTSWTSTIFYQLMCEINSKDQEGVRKMELPDYEQTYFPILDRLSENEQVTILNNFNEITFCDLKNPEAKNTDQIWAEILFENPEFIIEESLNVLTFMATERTSKF